MSAKPHPGVSQTAFGATASAPRLPARIEETGLLVGWSLEAVHRKNPIGFGFGAPGRTITRGEVDPVLFSGDGHLVTIAPTGAGKGVGCIVPALLRYPGPTIVIDPKGENVAVTARRRRELGHDVIVLDPIGITGLTPAATFNPLDLIDPDGATGVDEAAALAQLLLPSAGEPRDRFWLGRARQLVLGIVLHVVSDLPHADRTLGMVRELVNACAVDAAGIVQRLRGSRHSEAAAVANLLAIGASETLGGIVAFAQEGIDFLRGPLVQAAVETTSFDLDAVTRGDPQSIYVVLPPHMLESHGRLLRVWVGALMTLIVRRQRRPDLSTLFILDEAAQLGPLQELRQAMTLLRGYGLHTWTFWQDASQLKHLYPADWPTMLNNCRVVQLFGANTMLAAAEMAAISGFGDARAVLDLENDEMILQVAGDEPVIAKVPNYRSDPAFAGMFDPNPYHDQDLTPIRPVRTPLKRYMRPARPAPTGSAECATPMPRPRQPNPVDAELAARILKSIVEATTGRRRPK